MLSTPYGALAPVAGGGAAEVANVESWDDSAWDDDSVDGDDTAASTPVPAKTLLVQVLGGNPVTSLTVLACLTTADVNSLRRLHPALPAAVAGVPWADTAATVVNVVRWRKVLPAAVSARFTRRAVGDPARAAAELDGVTHLDLQGGDYVRAKLLRRLPASVRVLNVRNCRNLADNTSLTHFTALEGLNCGGTKLVACRAAGLPPSLQELDISDTYRHWNWPYCVPVAHLGALRVLRATCSGLCDKALAVLPPSLVELHAAQCWILSLEASFCHLPALRVLDVSQCAIGDATLASLPPSLVHLDMSGCGGLTPAASVSHLPALQWLDVSYTAIGDALVASLPPGMVELRLTSCQNVTRAVTLDHTPALRELHCEYTRLDYTVLTACRARGCVGPAAMQLLSERPYHVTLAVLADGRLVTGECNGEVKLWDLARVGEPIVLIEGSEEIVWGVCALAPLSDGCRLAIGTGASPTDSCIEVWDVDAQPPARCCTTITGCIGVKKIAGLRDGRLAASCYDSTNVWIVDGDVGAVVAGLEGHTRPVLVLVTLPNGRLASGSLDKSVRVWDVGAWACVATLTWHTDDVWSLVVLPDGRLVSRGNDCAVRLWDVDAAACVGVLAGHRGASTALAALPDGRLATIEPKSQTIWVWDTRPAAGPATNIAATASMLDLGRFGYCLSFLPLPDGRLVSVCNRRTTTSQAVSVHLMEVPPPA